MSSLLDVFVDVGARGLPQTEQDLQDFINRVSAAFGGLNKAAAVSVTSAGKAAGKKAAAAIVSDMRQAVLAFEQEKFEFDFQVRLLGDAGIRRQLSDLQSEVNAAKRQFALATDEAGQKAARERVDLARQELRLLEQQAEAARIAQGLAVPSAAAGDRERIFQQIRADAAGVNLELQQVSRLIAKASDPKLAQTFSDTREEIERINLELRTAIQGKDFVKAEQSLQQLQALRTAIESARTQAEKQIELKIKISDLRDQFQQIQSNAAALNLELQQAGRLITKAGDPKLARSFSDTREQAERINLELRTAIQNKDFIKAEKSLQDLQALRSGIAAARQQAEGQIDLKIRVPDLKNQFKALVNTLNVQLQSGDLGSVKVLDAADREEAVRYKAEINGLVGEFNRLAAQAELTTHDIQRMQDILDQLNVTNPTEGPVRGLQDLQNKTGKVSRSFNSLNNDAYQFGQLIEDAAIGYELNGIAGALRGAGNNASFLLQNFVAGQVAAKTMSFRMGLILTTMSAIGVAAAMIVIPRMLEWLDTLDDIEIKVRDIADMLKREFADVRLRIDLELDQEAQARALQQANDVIEAIQALIQRAQDRDNLRLKITATLDDQAAQTLFREATDATQQIADAARRQIVAIEAQAQTIANRAAARGARLQDFRQFISPDQQEQIKQLEELSQAAGEFNDLRERIFEDSKKGIVDPVALETARDSLQAVIDGLELLKGKVSDEDAKALEANIGAARDEMARLNEDAQRLQAILDANAAAMDAVRESASKISDELQFMNEVNQGNLAPEEGVLFDIEKQKEAFAEAAQELIELQGVTDEVVNTLEALAQKTQIEIVIKGQTELKKLNDDLVDLSVKIKDINEEIAQNAIDAAKKQQDAQAKAAEKIADLQAKLQDIATKKAFENQRSAIQTQIDFLRSQLDKVQPDQFEAGTLGTAIGGTGASEIESQISALEFQLRNLERARQQAEEAKQIADINKQIAETQNKLAEELKKIEEERIKAEEDLMIEMRGLGDIMIKLEEQEARLEEAIRNFDPTIQMPGGLPSGPAAAAEAAVMGSEWIQGIFDQLMQNTPQPPPGLVNPNIPPQARVGPLFRPEEPQFAPEDMPAIPDAAGMRAAQTQAMDAALSSADFKSSSLEGLIDQSNRLLSTLGDAVNKLDTAARYA